MKVKKIIKILIKTTTTTIIILIIKNNNLKIQMKTVIIHLTMFLVSKKSCRRVPIFGKKISHNKTHHKEIIKNLMI